MVADNISVHRGKLVRAWLDTHPRFRIHFTPVHCSWMNQVEQWFSILQRKRFRAPNVADLAELEAKVLAFIDEWNATAHPFKWTAASFDKVMLRAEGWRPRASLDRGSGHGGIDVVVDLDTVVDVLGRVETWPVSGGATATAASARDAVLAPAAAWA